jgi:hypothetical protein
VAAVESRVHLQLTALGLHEPFHLINEQGRLDGCIGSGPLGAPCAILNSPSFFSFFFNNIRRPHTHILFTRPIGFDPPPPL